MKSTHWNVAISDDIAFYDEIERGIKDQLAATTKAAPCTSEEVFIEVARDCHAIAAGDFPIGKAIIDQLDHCLVIAKFGVGVDPIDLAAARNHGIRVTNVPDYGMEDVASHAFAMMLALARHLKDYERIVRSGGWDKLGAGRIHRMHGRTIGILGLGRIGKTLARQVRGMECRVIANDPYIDPEIFSVHGVEQVDFDRLIRESDYLSLHVPLTEETRHIIGGQEMALMKPASFLINTSRGGVVDQVALYYALSSGQIAGAGIDVFKDEPILSDDGLLRLDNVILTPHVAWCSEDSKRIMASRVVEEIARALRGQPSRCPVVDVPLKQST